MTGCGNESQKKLYFHIAIDQDVFDFHLIEEGTYLRVVMMNRNNSERYKARGISEAFIRLSYELFRLPIYSSRNVDLEPSALGNADEPEWQTDHAKKVWQRLVASHEAYYNDDLKRFVYPFGDQQSVGGLA